jgi:hypothetical protein
MKRVRDCAYLIVKIWACCERIENVLTSMQKKPSRNYEYEKAPKQRSRLRIFSIEKRLSEADLDYGGVVNPIS